MVFNFFKTLFTILVLFAVLSSCENYKDPLDTSVLIPAPVFYGVDFIGHYESDSITSNGANVTNLVKVVLELQGYPGGLTYMESNPATGTSSIDSLNAQGGWNMNASHDTLFINMLVGSHSETKSVDTGSSDSGTTTTYETVIVNDYKEFSLPFKRVAPGKYILERSYKGANQKYFLTKW